MNRVPAKDAEWESLAQQYWIGKNYARAGEIYVAAARQFPRNFWPAFRAGCCAFYEQQFALAREWFEKARILNPDHVENQINLGVVYNRLDMRERATDQLRQVLTLSAATASQAALTHFNLGVILADQGDKTAAMEEYRRSVACRTDFSAAWLNLGMLWHDQGDYAQAETCYAHVLACEPRHDKAQLNLGNTYFVQQRLTEAAACYRQALAVNQNCCEARFNLGQILLLQGRFQDGLPLFEDRVQMKIYEEQNRLYTPVYAGRSRWQGEFFSCRRLLIHQDMGFGDTLQFSRYLPLVKQRGGVVLLAVKKPLLRLFAGFPGVDELVDEQELVEERTQFDLYVPFMTLPYIYGSTLATLPPPLAFVAESVDLPVRSGMRVGLTWSAARPPQSSPRSRSAALADLAGLAKVDGIDWYSLQTGEAAQEINQALAPGFKVRACLPATADFALTAAWLKEMDLVITVDTATAHLAGALGIPTWILLPFAPDWRWLLQREDSPWYPSVRLFRSAVAGDWPELAMRVAFALQRQKEC
ncbi:MAG TPA: tetratricopeptide repeat-containing glycosyltransferase family protein [Patescibacteria group bacterium]|nr:tetratricopeptide repeat-containing glycosyltransferase family protein [Patescibacteria group bacterium]